MAGLLSFLLLLQNLNGSEALRFSHVAEQGYDTSCGLSVLSDLVSRYWDKPIPEETFLSEWLALHEQREESFTTTSDDTDKDYSISFKDMQELLDLQGCTSKAFRFTYSQLVKAASTYAPLVLHFADREGHFVLCLSAEDEFLVIADPAEGVYWLSREDFLSRWQGYALLVQVQGHTKQQEVLNTILHETRAKRATLQSLSSYNSGVR